MFQNSSTGRYHAIRNATGTAVIKPSANPARIEIIELQKSCPSAPLSIIRLAASRIAGINGKLRAVFGLMDNAYHNRIAAAREISTHAHPGIGLHYSFFLFSISYSPFNGTFSFLFCIFFVLKITLKFRNSGSGSPISGRHQSTNSCVTSLPLSFIKLSGIFRS